jgi:hypothetical protein
MLSVAGKTPTRRPIRPSVQAAENRRPRALPVTPRCQWASPLCGVVVPWWGGRYTPPVRNPQACTATAPALAGAWGSAPARGAIK